MLPIPSHVSFLYLLVSPHVLTYHLFFLSVVLLLILSKQIFINKESLIVEKWVLQNIFLNTGQQSFFTV